MLKTHLQNLRTLTFLLAALSFNHLIQAQNIAATVAPNISGSDNFVDIKNNSGGNLYFYTDPSPSAARMSRVDSSGIAESPWPTVGNFAPDAGQSLNRIYPGEFLRVYPKTLGVGTVITVEFSYSPSGTHYHFNVTVTSGAQVTSINILDGNPTAAASVRWRVTFDQPVSGVKAANFAFSNPALITGLSIASVTADTTQPSSSWTITANTGSGNGLLGLNWTGHQTESPTVPNTFTGQNYDFTFLPIISQDPASSGINRNSTVTMTIVATLRGGGTLNYQWYSGTSVNPNSATAISGATSSSYTPPTFTTLGSFQYFCRAFTNPGNYRDSVTAVITVVDPPQISIQPASGKVATGQATSLSVGASGTSLSYQWYAGVSPNTSTPVGGNSSSYTTPALSANSSYWVRISNPGPTVVNSATANVTVIASLTPSAAGYRSVTNTAFGVAFAVTARDSANQVVANLPITFTAPSGAVASGRFPGLLVAASVNTDANGVATAPVFTADALAGTYNVVANFSTLAVNLPVTNYIRVVTSPASATFLTEITNSFNVAATGVLAPTITATGTLPTGVTLNPAGLLSGAPAAGSGGVYALTITVADGAGPNLTQNFTLTVVEKSSLAARPRFNTNGVGWALNGDSVNGGPVIANNLFTLTDGTAGESRSAWFRYPLYVGAFQAAFSYQDIGGGGADGAAFVIQNDSRGTAAIGLGGGGLAYSGITPSVAVLMNIYGGSPGGASGLMVGTNGVGAFDALGVVSGNPYHNTSPVNLDAGNPVNVNLRYTGGILQVSLTDTVTLATFQTNYAVNIPGFVGGSTALVGITGCEGGVLSHQTVSNFTFAPLPTLSVNATATNTVVLSWPQAIVGFSVQSKTQLSDAAWVTVPGPVNQVNGQNQVVIASSAGPKFCRLVLSPTQ